MDKRCQAMIDAGIKNPESQEGKDFCTQRCPYTKCVVYETKCDRADSMQRRVERAKELTARGYDVRTVAKIMDMGVRTINRYLDK